MNNKFYVYNDNFLSLLALIVILIRKKTIPKDIKPCNFEFGLFDEVEELLLPEKEETINYIIKNIWYDNFNMIFMLYLSVFKDK